MHKLCTCTLLVVVVVLAVARAEVPCDCGETPTQCLVNPCEVNSPKCAKGCVAKYCNGCKALCRCTADQDCKFGEWCRATSQAGLSVCVPFRYTGEKCGGFVMLQCVNRCAPGFTCTDTNTQIIDEPGLCYRQCEKGKCCGNKVYCAPSSNVCIPKGSCVTDADCKSQSKSARPGCSYRCVPGAFGTLAQCKLQCRPVAAATTTKP